MYKNLRTKNTCMHAYMARGPLDKNKGMYEMGAYLHSLMKRIEEITNIIYIIWLIYKKI